MALIISSDAHAGEFNYRLSGLVQPMFSWQQRSGLANVRDLKFPSFEIRRARLIFLSSYATGPVHWEGRFEVDIQPSNFQLLDAYVAAYGDIKGNGFWRVELGQTFVPFSRQMNTLATYFQFVNQARMVDQFLVPGFTSADETMPQRQLGLTGTLAIPFAQWLQISAGVFNGNGRNLPNPDNNFMYAARVAIRPVGPRAKIVESALGEDAVWLAGHFLYNKKLEGSTDAATIMAGADAFFSWKGISAYAEFLWGNRSYDSKDIPAFDFQGLNVQAGYLLPIPGFLYRRFEVAGRIEAFAPNKIAPVGAPGDKTQARLSYVLGLNYYHRGHQNKVMFNYYRNQELDTVDVSGRPATYNNDAIYLLYSFSIN